jgi:hypothetical protein
LNKIATQLNKPKAQVVESLVKGYDEAMKEREKATLDKFNKEMGAKVKALKFSNEIQVNTDTIDDDFAVLANTDYGK